jgi:hypothetical protein
MPRRRPFRQVDVFTSRPYAGNPVAVVLDGTGLSTEDMERFTRWTNLSEATFVLPPSDPDADYRVRIFTAASPTPARGARGAELPFAGHATLGTCHAWLERHAEAGRLVQECGAGFVPVRRGAGGLAFAAPPLVRSGPVGDTLIEDVATALRIDRTDIVDAASADNRPGWLAVLLRSADAVLELEPTFLDLDLGFVALPGGLGRRLRSPRVLPEERSHGRGPGDRKLERVPRTVAPRQRPGGGAVHREPGNGPRACRPHPCRARRRRDDLGRGRHDHLRERPGRALAMTVSSGSSTRSSHRRRTRPR